MHKTVSYSEARANLAKLWDEVVDDRSYTILKRRGKEDVALIAASELSSMLETLYLFSNPNNAKRLMESIERAEKGEGISMTIKELEQQVMGKNELIS